MEYGRQQVFSQENRQLEDNEKADYIAEEQRGYAEPVLNFSQVKHKLISNRPGGQAAGSQVII